MSEEKIAKDAIFISASNEQISGEFVDIEVVKQENAAAACNGHCVGGTCKS